MLFKVWIIAFEYEVITTEIKELIAQVDIAAKSKPFISAIGMKYLDLVSIVSWLMQKRWILIYADEICSMIIIKLWKQLQKYQINVFIILVNNSGSIPTISYISSGLN